MNLDTIAIDPTRLSAGVWWDFEARQPCADKSKPHATHFCVRVAPFGVEYLRALDDLKAPHLPEARANKGRLPDAVFDEIRGRAIASTVLLDWANASVGGKDYPYNRNNAVELMTNQRWHLLRKFVEQAAENEAALLAEEEELASGN